MIKVSVLYPNGDGKTFDIAYYVGTHMPLVERELGEALKGMAVDHGLAGGAPGVAPPFVAMGHLLFDSVEAFQTAFDAHAKAIMDDIPNYTNIQPTIVVSEVKL